MAKIWGLDVPINFQEDFGRLVKLDWFNSVQRATLKIQSPAKNKARRIAARSYIPDFIDDWRTLNETQQSLWSKDWGSGGEQAFALFFQNNYYRQINSLELRDSPNFFTHPTGHLHFGSASVSQLLQFEINNDDYITQFQDNIHKPQNPIICNFQNLDELRIRLKAKLTNYSDPSGVVPFKMNLYLYDTNGLAYSREDEEWRFRDPNDIYIDDTFEELTSWLDDSLWVKIIFNLNFYLENCDFWFYDCYVTGVDLVLGSIRLQNSNNMRDVGQDLLRLAPQVKKQWSLINTSAGSYIEDVFPYAAGYPDET